MHSDEQQKLLLQAVTRYAAGLDEATVRYLDGRGISVDVAKQFSLGTVTDPEMGHEQFVGWLSIPYFSAMGHCVSVKFRRLDDGKPKYGQPTGQKLHVYNVADVLQDRRHIAICEGELDAIVVSGICGIPAVGIPGVQAWKPYYSKLFGGFDSVYVIGDNDQKEDGTNPGAEFSRRVSSEVINSRIVSLPVGMDINEYYLAHGLEATQELLGGVR
jgi:DNA primase